MTSLLPTWLVVVILSRDVMLIGGSLHIANRISQQRGEDLFRKAISLELDSPLEIKVLSPIKLNVVFIL
jgi:hypothetical protein